MPDSNATQCIKRCSGMKDTPLEQEPDDSVDEHTLVYGTDESLQAISDHIETHIGKIGVVLHEIASDYIHVDVHHIPPTVDRNFHSFVTSGMSNRPMKVSPEAA